MRWVGDTWPRATFQVGPPLPLARAQLGSGGLLIPGVLCPPRGFNEGGRFRRFALGAGSAAAGSGRGGQGQARRRPTAAGGRSASSPRLRGAGAGAGVVHMRGVWSVIRLIPGQRSQYEVFCVLYFVIIILVLNIAGPWHPKVEIPISPTAPPYVSTSVVDGSRSASGSLWRHT